jgi:predicted PurR-regulated permease PerM
MSGERRGLARAGATAWRLLGVGLLVVAAWWLARRLMPVLLPLVVALMLATLLRPAAASLRRRGVPPAAAALAAMVLLVLVVAAAVALVVPPFVARLEALGANVHEGLREVTYSVAHDLAGVSRAQADRLVDDALSNLDAHRSQIAGDVLAGVSMLAQGLAAAVLVVFLCFFLVKDGTSIGRWFVRFAPVGRRAEVATVGAECWRALGTYIRGVVFVATVDAVFIGLALLLVGVPLAMPLIVLTWVGAFFPIIGALVAGVVAVLVTLVAKGLTAALIVLGAIIVVQQLEGNVLYPIVVGPRLRLHPIAVLLAVTIGGTVAGIPGAFLAVPLATVGAVVLAHARAGIDEAPHVRRLAPTDPPAHELVHGRA